MFNLKNLIESTVKEVLNELAPEAPEDASFGKYLFAPVRMDLEPSDRQELNTPMEDVFFHALRDHYKGNPKTLGQLADEIKNMTDRGWYEKILASPEDTVYRYITDVPTELAARILGTTVQELERQAKDEPWEAQAYGPGVIKPGGPWSKDSGISSWSTQLDWEWISTDLAPSPLKPGQTAILLAADAGEDTNFFINPNNIHNVGSLPVYAYHQNEVIAYGPVRYARAWALTNGRLQPRGNLRSSVVFDELNNSVDYH